MRDNVDHLRWDFGHLDVFYVPATALILAIFIYATRHFCYFHIHSISVQQCVARVYFFIHFMDNFDHLVQNYSHFRRENDFLWCHFKWKTPWLWYRQRSHCSRLSCRICREPHHSEWSSSSIYSFHSEKHCSRTRMWKILYEFRCSISVEKLILATVRHSAPKPINSTTYIQSIQVNN